MKNEELRKIFSARAHRKSIFIKKRVAEDVDPYKLGVHSLTEILIIASIKTNPLSFRVSEQCEAFASKRMRERQVGVPRHYLIFSKTVSPDANLILIIPRSERPSAERKVNKNLKIISFFKVFEDS